jgi:hypothetical protein
MSTPREDEVVPKEDAGTGARQGGGATRAAILGLGLIAAALTARYAFGWVSKPHVDPVDQPIAFNHAKHVAGSPLGSPNSPQLPCVFCHAGVETEAHAGLPPLELCLGCHMRPRSTPTSDPQTIENEKRVREVLLNPGPRAFVPVTAEPGHVRFSHRAHVNNKENGSLLGAGLVCADCHGDVSRWTAPPREPAAYLINMNNCIDCHKKRGAPTTCVHCHR